MLDPPGGLGVVPLNSENETPTLSRCLLEVSAEVVALSAELPRAFPTMVAPVRESQGFGPRVRGVLGQLHVNPDPSLNPRPGSLLRLYLEWSVLVLIGFFYGDKSFKF